MAMSAADNALLCQLLEAHRGRPSTLLPEQRDWLAGEIFSFTGTWIRGAQPGIWAIRIALERGGNYLGTR